MTCRDRYVKKAKKMIYLNFINISESLFMIAFDGFEHLRFGINKIDELLQEWASQ